jgi:hypothetical protein
MIIWNPAKKPPSKHAALVKASDTSATPTAQATPVFEIWRVSKVADRP